MAYVEVGVDPGSPQNLGKLEPVLVPAAWGIRAQREFIDGFPVKLSERFKRVRLKVKTAALFIGFQLLLRLCVKAVGPVVYIEAPVIKLFDHEHLVQLPAQFKEARRGHGHDGEVVPFIQAVHKLMQCDHTGITALQRVKKPCHAHGLALVQRKADAVGDEGIRLVLREGAEHLQLVVYGVKAAEFRVNTAPQLFDASVLYRITLRPGRDRLGIENADIGRGLRRVGGPGLRRRLRAGRAVRQGKGREGTQDQSIQSLSLHGSLLSSALTYINE